MFRDSLRSLDARLRAGRSRGVLEVPRALARTRRELVRVVRPHVPVVLVHAVPSLPRQLLLCGEGEALDCADGVVGLHAGNRWMVFDVAARERGGAGRGRRRVGRALCEDR